jgi:hypothetical protein
MNIVSGSLMNYLKDTHYFLITIAVIVSACIFIGECDKIAPANQAKGRCSITCLGCDSFTNNYFISMNML